MKNLAGDSKCDKHIRKELELANVPFEEHEFLRQGEVPSSVIGILNGWTFKRAWYYWVVSSDKNTLLFEYSCPLHETYGTDVRVDGHCASPSPKEWFKESWHIGVNLYHVDTQEGLIALVNAIKTQASE